MTLLTPENTSLLHASQITGDLMNNIRRIFDEIPMTMWERYGELNMIH